jgi:hypothetical protein
VAGDGAASYGGDGGAAINAALDVPGGVAEDAIGSLYIADTQNNRVRKVVMPQAINKDTITTIAGNGTAGYSGDGGPATSAELSAPSGVVVNAAGDVFIADSKNNRVREVSPSGVITTFAGIGSCSMPSTSSSGAFGNGGPASKAALCGPTGLALDNSGDLFIGDTGHNMVREVLPNGTIVGFSGSGMSGSKGDGSAAAKAQLSGPTGVAVDAVGNVYIADTGNCEVRIVSGGIIQRFAGKGADDCGFSGDGGAAKMTWVNHPTGLGVDPSGDVFIADTNNQRIREVNASGTISTYGGTGVAGFSGDGGSATAAKINTPTGNLAVDASSVYFADSNNERVRVITSGPPPVLPQAGVAILLPLTGGLVVVGGALLVMLRRRRRTASHMAA